MKSVRLALIFTMLLMAMFGDSALAQLTARERLKSQTELNRLMVKIFQKIQSARVLSDPERIQQAATIVAGRDIGIELERIFNNESSRFVIAREQALRQVPVRKNGKQIVVTGLSVSGSAAALMAANAGYEVTGIEKRDTFTRNIQWTGRQSLIDMLAVIDPQLADRFLAQFYLPVEQEIHLVDHAVDSVTKLSKARSGDPTKIPSDAEKLINEESIMVLRTKEFENFMMLAVLGDADIDVRKNQTIVPVKNDKGYEIAGLGTPELIVVAEGSGSTTRKAMGIPFEPTSPRKLQIAGELAINIPGQATFDSVKKTYPDGEVEFLLTSAISRPESGVNWSVTDVPRTLQLDPAGLDPESSEFKRIKQERTNAYYIKVLSNILHKTEEEIRTRVLSGPFEGSLPTSFWLQQFIAKSAIFGKNAVGIGDAVGTGHWIVGGGVHVALIMHLRRLANLLFDLEIGRNKAEAMAEYGTLTMKDSLEWGRQGIAEFFPRYEEPVVRRRYLEATERWQRDPIETKKSPLSYIIEAMKSETTFDYPSAAGGRCGALLGG